MQALLSELTPTQVRQKSAAIWERLSVLSAFAGAECVLVYVSNDHEVDTHGLIRQLLAMGRCVCVPAFVDGYVPAEIADFDADLVAGKFGILEPRTVRRVPAEKPDVWLVPGLAFDLKGYRLGRGQGYFDALLRSARGRKIALAHDFQVLTEVPAEPHDVGMDFIVTETRVVECKRN